jgi:phosphatidylinositol alpha-1,6-mannosyltransferase
MTTTLVVTNDFPPTIGGIEAFVAQVCHLLGDVVVLTRDHPQAAATDRALPFPVHRCRTPALLPTGRTASAAARLLRQYRATRVVYGAAAPLGLLASRLRRAGARHQLAISHGHEIGWARLPVTRRALRRIGDQVDAISYISGFTRDAIAPALSPTARSALVRLAPPVDTERFVPRSAPRRPTVVAAGRMVRQKGFGTLMAAWERLLWDWRGPPPELVVIGDGPDRRRLGGLARRLPPGTVRWTGPVPHADMPAVLADAHVFALPVRTRFGGLYPEGLGLVFAEAAACGLAVLAGDSGGTADTLVPGESGLLLEPDDPADWARALTALLRDAGLARRMGERGRAHVVDQFSPAQVAAVLGKVLDLPGSSPSPRVS